MAGEESSRNFWIVALVLGAIYVGRRAYKYEKKHGLVIKVRNWWKERGEVRVSTA